MVCAPGIVVDCSTSQKPLNHRGPGRSWSLHHDFMSSERPTIPTPFTQRPFLWRSGGMGQRSAIATQPLEHRDESPQTPKARSPMRDSAFKRSTDQVRLSICTQLARPAASTRGTNCTPLGRTVGAACLPFLSTSCEAKTALERRATSDRCTLAASRRCSARRTEHAPLSRVKRRGFPDLLSQS